MKIFHTADLHYCPKHLNYVDAALGRAWDSVLERDAPGAWVIAGDSFDSTMGIHQPAFARYVGRIMQMSSVAPGIVLQGTFSHDYPGSLDALKELQTEHPILVADEPGAWLLHKVNRSTERWDRLTAETMPLSDDLLCAICAPSLNRADPAVRDLGPGEYVKSLAEQYAPITKAYREAGVPTILVTHGTVVGCTTESKHAMVSPDHEFSVETLAAFGADAVMLGHIHKHQSWDHAGCQIVYPGSLAKLVFGHDDPTGYVCWDTESWTWDHIEVPSRSMIELEWDGPPGMDEVEAIADDIRALETDEPVFVRVRWSIDQEHAARVNVRKIRSIIEDSGATVKIDQRINRVQSVRAKGIGEAVSMEDKIKHYLSTTGDDESLADALQERLALTMSHEPEVVAKMATGRQA